MKKYMIVLSIFPILIWSMILLTEMVDFDLPLVIKAVIIVFGFLYLPLVWLMQRYRLTRLYRTSPYLTEPLSGFITNDKLHLENKLGQCDLPWTVFIRYMENDDMVLLYQSPIIFQLLAKEFFVSQENWERAKREIITNIQSKRA